MLHCTGSILNQTRNSPVVYSTWSSTVPEEVCHMPSVVPCWPSALPGSSAPPLSWVRPVSFSWHLADILLTCCCHPNDILLSHLGGACCSPLLGVLGVSWGVGAGLQEPSLTDLGSHRRYDSLPQGTLAAGYFFTGTPLNYLSTRSPVQQKYI